VFEQFAKNKPKEDPGKAEVITAGGEEPAKK